MIATGGTIASKGTADGLAPELTSQDILHYIPSLKDICEVETLQLCNLDSTNISMEHWMMMANAIEEKYEKYDGFVICHGTDTMAYTASALSYLVQHSPKPIVLTGSQKPVDMEITDARANLLPQSSASMRWCTVFVSIYQEAEFCLDLLVGQTQCLEHLLLQFVIGDTDGTA